MRYHNINVSIRLTDEVSTRSVEVLYRIGKWAVHRSIDNEDTFTVTHVPSGCAAGGRLFDAHRARKRAIAFHNTRQDLWNFTDPQKMSPTAKRLGAQIVNGLID